MTQRDKAMETVEQFKAGIISEEELDDKLNNIGFVWHDTRHIEV